MEHSIDLSDDGTYVVLRTKGDFTARSIMQTIRECHEFGRRHGTNRILFDARESRNVDSTLGNYEFAYKNMQRDEEVDRTARVVGLVSPGDHSHDFVETVARNAGLDLTLFTDHDLAVRHLKDGR